MTNFGPFLINNIPVHIEITPTPENYHNCSLQERADHILRHLKRVWWQHIEIDLGDNVEKVIIRHTVGSKKVEVKSVQEVKIHNFLM